MRARNAPASPFRSGWLRGRRRASKRTVASSSLGGGPVLLARQGQFVLVQRSVRQRPQFVGNCFVPHIIWMKPVGGEQSSSYWVLRSGCAVEREVDRGILPGRSIRVVPGRPAAAAHGHKEEEEDKR